MDMLARALSLRVIGLSLLAGIGAYVLVALVFPSAGFWVMWLIAAATYALAVWGGGDNTQMIRCDACGKRVKLGAERCHHCGYSRAA